MLLMPRAVLAAQLVAVVVCVMTPTVTAQTEEEVRDAVSKCIGLAPENDEARDKLKRWGDDALPLLRRMASELYDSGGEFHLVVAISMSETQLFADLLVDLAVQKRNLDLAFHAIWKLSHWADRLRTRQFLDNERSRDRLIAVAGSSATYGSDLGHLAEIIEDMQWKEGLPALRKMVDDSDLDVRRRAAQAIQALTGENVRIDEPTIRFPREEIDESFVELVGAIHRSSRSGRSVGFLVGPTGESGLISPTDNGTVALFNLELQPVQELPLPATAKDYLALPTGDGQTQVLAILRREDEGLTTTELKAFALDGGTRWRFGRTGEEIESMTPLYRGGNIHGVVACYDSNIEVVVLDLDGNRLWQRHDLAGEYVDSHPGLSRPLILMFGAVVILDVLNAAVDDKATGLVMSDELLGISLEGSDQPWVFVDHAQLFLDSAGKRALVIAFPAPDSVPKVARWDEQGYVVWQADVVHKVIGLCRIEPPGGTRLFAATTKAGDVLVFDEDGALKHQGDLGLAMKRFRKRDGSVSATIYGMKSGQLGDSTVFTISLRSQTLVYKVNL